MMSNYWSRTDDIKKALGGENPTCAVCEQPVYPMDDHGRFHCMNFECANYNRTIRL